MPAPQKFDDFTNQLGLGAHNFASHTFKAAFSNTAPVVANTILANISQIAAGNGYSAGGVTLSGVTWTTSAGVAKLAITDNVFTATGGAVGPLRYVTIYNDTQTTPAKPLICFVDYGSSITLADGETLTLDFDATNGVITIT